MKLKDAMRKAKGYGYDYVTIDDNGDIYAFEHEPLYQIDEDGGFWDEGGLDGKVVFLSESDYIGGEFDIVDIRNYKP